MGQLRLPRQEYVRFLRTDRLKNDLQPGEKILTLHFHLNVYEYQRRLCAI